MFPIVVACLLQLQPSAELTVASTQRVEKFRSNAIGLELNPLLGGIGFWWEHRFGKRWLVRGSPQLELGRGQLGNGRPGTVYNFGAELGVSRYFAAEVEDGFWLGLRLGMFVTDKNESFGGYEIFMSGR